MGSSSWKAGEPMVRIELPTPAPGKNQVVVDVHAIGVNPVDWKMRTAGPLRVAARALSAVQGPKPPVVIGVDFAGVVAAVGPQVQGFAPGDRVVGGCNFSRAQRGSYADTVVVFPDQICKVPDSVPIDVAGCLPVAGVTAHMALTDYQPVGPASRVLVLGASGGVGQFAVQIAKRVLGAAFVGGVCSGKNAALVRELGADEVFDYTAGDALQAAAARGPYDVLVDGVGTYPAANCRKLLSACGAHVMVAGDKAEHMLQIAVPPFRSKAILATPDGAHIAPVLQAVAEGKVVVHIAHRLPLHQAQQAHDLSQSGRVVGKIVLVVDRPQG
ncbi:MAG: NAD(P)-dependent alcohol dehydrogenase [Deltaproteobacteria bacterium]|nr:NAD(P)-dependent alcohol dehydrogenase [Deltaproteobacteria bacterium]